MFQIKKQAFVTDWKIFFSPKQGHIFTTARQKRGFIYIHFFPFVYYHDTPNDAFDIENSINSQLL